MMMMQLVPMDTVLIKVSMQARAPAPRVAQVIAIAIDSWAAEKGELMAFENAIIFQAWRKNTKVQLYTIPVATFIYIYRFH